jgi:hypothetical protein
MRLFSLISLLLFALLFTHCTKDRYDPNAPCIPHEEFTTGPFWEPIFPQNLSSLSGFPLIQQIRMRFPSFFGSEEVVDWAYLI